tara:strand:+ start:61 stop:558 length:498 start_codon:yes stop_codon:yes gene_type:complete
VIKHGKGGACGAKIGSTGEQLWSKMAMPCLAPCFGLGGAVLPLALDVKQPVNNGSDMKTIKSIAVVALGTALLSACSWVDLNPAAEDILVLKPFQTKQCEQVRRTTSQVLDKIWFVNRNQEKMAEELATLARNTAAELGGNAVVPDSEIEEGKQTFIILNCPHLR